MYLLSYNACSYTLGKEFLLCCVRCQYMSIETLALTVVNIQSTLLELASNRYTCFVIRVQRMTKQGYMDFGTQSRREACLMREEAIVFSPFYIQFGVNDFPGLPF